MKALRTNQVKFVNWYAGIDTETSADDHLGPVRAYLRDHYHVAQVYSNGDEIGELNASGN
jgi:hypothetical protein